MHARSLFAPRPRMPHLAHPSTNRSLLPFLLPGHVPADILHCGVPSIKEAPDNLWSIMPSGPNWVSEAHHDAKQSAWILCNTVGRINGVLDMYKSRFCPGGSYVRDKTVRLIQGKTRDTGCDWTKQKWCWPLAQIEEESPAPDMSLPPNGGF